jgi:hypothetical protein
MKNSSSDLSAGVTASHLQSAWKVLEFPRNV